MAAVTLLGSVVISVLLALGYPSKGTPNSGNSPAPESRVIAIPPPLIPPGR
jgi:hypothetical protein